MERQDRDPNQPSNRDRSRDHRDRGRGSNSRKRDYHQHKQSHRRDHRDRPPREQPQSTVGVGHVLPLEVLDKCIGRKLWILMKNEREFFGTLTGFTDSTDSNMALVLQNVKEYTFEGGNGGKRYLVN